MIFSFFPFIEFIKIPFLIRSLTGIRWLDDLQKTNVTEIRVQLEQIPILGKPERDSYFQ